MKKNSTISVNYARDPKNEIAVSELFTAINFCKFEMLVSAQEDSISKLEKALLKDELSADEVKVLTVKLANAKKVLAGLRAEVEEARPIYSLVLNAIVNTEKKYLDDNLQEQVIKNTASAVRNVFRVSACGTNKSLFRYALDQSEISDIEGLYDALKVATDIKKATSNGMRSRTAEQSVAYENATRIVFESVKEMFSIPVENHYTTAVKINIKNIHLAAIYDIFLMDFDYSEGENLGFKTSIRKKVSKGCVTYDASIFCKQFAYTVSKYLLNMKVKRTEEKKAEETKEETKSANAEEEARKKAESLKRKIESLKNMTVARGASPAEEETAKRMIEKLQKKLDELNK